MSATAELTLKQAGEALRAGQVEQALTLAQSLADAPQSSVSAAALHIVSLALTRLGRPKEAENLLSRLLKDDPGNTAAWLNLATAQDATGHADDAIVSLTRALKIAPDYAPAHFNLGLLYAKRQDWTQAEAHFSRAASLTSEWLDAHCQRADALIHLNRCAEAQRLLQTVLAQHPTSARGWFLMGQAHQELAQTSQALACYDKAQHLTSDPATLAVTHANLAALLQTQDIDSALQHARRAAQLHPDLPSVQGILASVLLAADQPDAAYQAAQREYTHHGNSPAALSLLAQISGKRCDWRRCEDQLAALMPTLQGENGDVACAAITPVPLLSFLFDPAELQRITRVWTASKFRSLQPATPAMRARYIGQPRPQRLRIGYFSADFHLHATMSLMAGLFEAHDKARFETIGICYGSYGDRSDDAMRSRAKRAFDRFVSVTRRTDPEIVQLAREMDIHIAVDLKGFTEGTRLGAFAERVAPIQMHYLGYPGTLGMSGAIDYLVADRVLIPEASRRFYSEKIIEMPDSYQVNDRQRAIDPVVPSRIELGLPKNAFVFCCFNNNYKITREVFELWLQLLKAKEGSVLWLLADNDTAVRNLKQAARGAWIDPSRIVFAQRAELSRHLARHAQADLFLDTWPVNAHTTASDALWAGVPVLTCMGETFASRVGASLLTACHLPELITRTPQDYLNKAKELAHNPEQLKAIRRKLQDTRLTVPLFDTVRFTRHLEKAYDLAWERLVEGLPPDHITVPPMA